MDAGEEAAEVEHLLAQGAVTPEQIADCRARRAQLAAEGVTPLPSLKELLVEAGHLASFQNWPTVATTPAAPPAPASEPGPRGEEPLPPEAAAAASVAANMVGKYVRVRRIGAGAMGEVWRAWDRELRRWVALKFLKSHDADELARFKREAQTAARLAHPNIAAIHEVGEDGGRPFIAMQFIDGVTLGAIRDAGERVHVEIVRDAALALHVAHELGIVHRDIKPDNLMVARESATDSTSRRSGARRQVYVMDFGLAKQTALETSISVSGSIFGTPAYMPPEQAQGRLRDVGRRSDVYSLGATLYDMLGGGPPFRGEGVYEVINQVVARDPVPLRKANPRIDVELETIVMKCLEKDQEARYATALELAEDLSRWLEGEPILAHRPSVRYRVRKFVARRRGPLAAGVAGLLLAAGTAVILIVPGWREEAEARRRSERELDEQRARERRAAAARADARPHLDAGRAVLQQLDRLLTTAGWRPEEAEALASRARVSLSRALELDPQYSEAWLDMARSHAMVGADRDAEECCGKALEASPGLATAHLERALLLLVRYENLRHEVGGAIREETAEVRDLRRRIDEDLAAVKEWSKDPEQLLVAEGAIDFAEGRYEQAARRLQQYAESRLTDFRAWAWAGHAWHHVPGREREALASLTEAIRFRPMDTVPIVLRGHVRRMLGDLDGAVKDYDRALEIHPRVDMAFLGRGYVKYLRKDYRGAIRDYDRATEANPRLFFGFSHRALARLAEGDADGCMQDFDEAIRLNPKEPTTYAQRGDAKRALGRPKDAVADYETALRVAPADWEYRAIVQRNLSLARGEE